MSNLIHPSAIVDPKAELGENNYIGPFCIIGPTVVMGSHNRLESHVTLGASAQHRDYFLQPPGEIRIGDHNVIREFVSINAGTTAPTIIANKVSLLVGSHVGHDAVVKDSSIIGAKAIVGGHAIIGVGANLGLATVIHQYRVIGAYAMIGMNSTVTRDQIPFSIAFGSPCETHRLNRIGLQRAGLSNSDLSIFEEWFSQTWNKSLNLPTLKHFFQKYIFEYQHDKQVWNIGEAAS